MPTRKHYQYIWTQFHWSVDDASAMNARYPLLVWFLVVIGFISAAGIAVERYIGVFHPLRYEEFVTERRINVFMLITMLYSIVIPLAPFLGENNWHSGK